MNFNKENMRHMRHLIVFTLVLLIALWNYTKVFGFLGFLWNIAFPFLMGGAIAFILNVPMSFLERNIFKNETALKNKRVQKLSRPVSLVLTIIGVLGIVAIVMFVVIPQLGQTFVSLGRNIQHFIPQAILGALGKVLNLLRHGGTEEEGLSLALRKKRTCGGWGG